MLCVWSKFLCIVNKWICKNFKSVVMDINHGASNGAGISNPDTTSISTIVVKSGVLQLVVAILQVRKPYMDLKYFFYFYLFISCDKNH